MSASGLVEICPSVSCVWYNVRLFSCFLYKTYIWALSAVCSYLSVPLPVCSKKNAANHLLFLLQCRKCAIPRFTIKHVSKSGLKRWMRSSLACYYPQQKSWFKVFREHLWSLQCWQLLKEAERYPGTRISTSTLLSHLVAPLYVVTSNNIDLCKGWAFIHNRPVVLHNSVDIHRRERDVHEERKVPKESLPRESRRESCRTIQRWRKIKRMMHCCFVVVQQRIHTSNFELKEPSFQTMPMSAGLLQTSAGKTLAFSTPLTKNQADFYTYVTPLLPVLSELMSFSSPDRPESCSAYPSS